MKEATNLLKQKSDGTSSDKRSQQQIIDDLNKSYGLTDESGKENSREKKMLALAILERRKRRAGAFSTRGSGNS